MRWLLVAIIAVITVASGVAWLVRGRVVEVIGDGVATATAVPLVATVAVGTVLPPYQ